MFCILKYIDYANYKQLQTESKPILKNNNNQCEDTNSLNSTLYFNPNAFLQSILQYICEELHLDMSSDYDICNESGELMRVKNFKATTSGLSVFRQRETYIPVILIQNANNELEDISPMLNPTSDLYLITTKNLKIKYFKPKLSGTSIKKQSNKNYVTVSKEAGSIQRKSSSAH